MVSLANVTTVTTSDDDVIVKAAEQKPADVAEVTEELRYFADGEDVTSDVKAKEVKTSRK